MSKLREKKRQPKRIAAFSQGNYSPYFLRTSYRSPSVQCWIIPMTAFFASLTNSTPVPSMVKLFSECAISGIFPSPPGLIMRRLPSRETTTPSGNMGVS